MKHRYRSGCDWGHDLSRLILIGALFFFMANRTPAEIIFQDSFAQTAGSVTNSIPALDVEGNGWQITAPDSGLVTDGQGHLSAATTNGGAAGIQLIPIGPHGFMTVTATVHLPTNSAEWIGFGFGNTNQFLASDASQSGPWVKVQGDGAITLYGGTGTNNPIQVPGAYTNTGSPIEFALIYNAFTSATSVGMVLNGTTNIIFDSVPLTNTVKAVTARYLNFQFPTNTSTPDTRWVSDVAVDWFPRPRPLLTLPTPPPENIVFVGDPNTNGDSDITLIQNKLDKVAAITNGAEIRFQAGATYVITNDSTEPGVPVLLQYATNVLVNGNGCKILIKNPHLGFFDLYQCQNVIVQGFTVDYDPLPFTQGVVTTNLSDTEDAFEYRVDSGYPLPSRAYFSEIAQWGTFMDPTRPGRLADNHSTIYDFDCVTNTTESDVFKVKLKNRSKLSTIHAGDIWCQLARFNGATLFRARFSSQITFLNLTNYTGAAAAFAGNASSLVNEINCQIVIGPSPGGTNGKPRVKTTNADGGLFGNPRIGPWVEGCNFIGLSDDVANANTLPLFFADPVTGPTNRFFLKTYDPGGTITDLVDGEVEVGDDVFLYNGTDGAVFDHATITAVNPPYCTFDHDLTNIFSGTDTTNTCIFDNSLNTSAVYLNNQFSNSRIHGIYCRANNILIAHNFITGMGSSAIAAHPALSLAGPNSFAPTNCIIMDNVLADGGCSYEAINNVDPTDEPVWALLQLHKAIATTDYVPAGAEISGIRILNNAFLQWRRGAITLHNVSDANIIGNYFSLPMTNNGLTSLDYHVVADLWACDYSTLRFENNVKSTLMPDGRAISAEDYYTNIPGAFQPLDQPQLKLMKASDRTIINWDSHTPAFVLQQAEDLTAPNWFDVTTDPDVYGNSNAVDLPFARDVPARFYRTRQR
ncbi:MAG TPA: hypothetical protein VGO57_01895 [Verrucomicrobiae bacterium]